MIICSSSNIDLIYGIEYADAEGITDWRITNTATAVVGQSGVFNIMNSTSSIPNMTIIDNGNIGIGTSTNINNKLQLYNDNINTTTLSITNNKSTFTDATTPSFTLGGPDESGFVTTTENSPDKFMIFKTTGINHTFTINAENIFCDILMIGGGGAGGGGAGGGGAGACIVALNQTFIPGSYNISVGAGEVGWPSPALAIPTVCGGDSLISRNGTIIYLAKGGGRGGSTGASDETNHSGYDGGCGGGAGFARGSTRVGGNAKKTNIVNGSIINSDLPIISTTYAILGNKGGNQNDTGLINSTGDRGAGGGGIGNVGVDHNSGNNDGSKGGNGLNTVTINQLPYNFKSYFANNSVSFGVDNGYIGGGGGGFGALSLTKSEGGIGGGGVGNSSGFPATSGSPNTGSGGGGGHQSGSGIGNIGDGGSGIVIIRYRTSTSTTIGTSAIELIRGVAGDTNTDYKIGNYKGDFKIISSTSGTADIESLNISSQGKIGIGIKPISSSSKLEVIGDINITGNYKKNNRDVIDDTSNYILATSNYLINYNNLINKPSIGDAQVNSDWNSTTGKSQILNKPDFPALSSNTSNYIARINTELITSIGTKQDILTSANTIGVFNTNDFVNNASKIELSKNTSNYVARINSELITSIGTKQATLSQGTGITITGSTISTSSTSLISLFQSAQFEDISSVIKIKDNWKPSTAGAADTAVNLLTTRAIAGVNFDGSGPIDIPYFNLTYKLKAGTGISITAGTATSQPEISASAQTPTSLSLVEILNASQFSNNTNTNRVDINTISVAKGGTGATTLTSGQILIGNGTNAVLQDSNLTWDNINKRLGIGTNQPTTALHVTGEIVATGNITAFQTVSDDRLKTRIMNVREPLKIIDKLNGFYYKINDLGHSYGINSTETEIGVSAQEVNDVLPELVDIAPFDRSKDENGINISKTGENYLCVSYERLAAVFVEAIKELNEKNRELVDKYNILLESIASINKNN